MQVPKTFWWVVGSIVLMVVGAFGPWAKVLGILTVDGTDDGNDGWIVVGAAAVAAIALGCFFRWWPNRWLLVLPLLAGATGAVTAGYDIGNINSVAPSDNSLFGADVVDTGWGIYLALISSISLILASIAMWVEVRRRVAAVEVQEKVPPPS